MTTHAFLRQRLAFCLVYGVGVSVLLAAPVLAERLHNYICDGEFQPGCGVATVCQTATAHPCNGGGTSQSKKRVLIQFQVCYSQAGCQCEQGDVVCAHIKYYKQSACTDDCDIVEVTTAGCVPIP